MSRALLRLLLLSGVLVAGFAAMPVAADVCPYNTCDYQRTLCNRTLVVQLEPVDYCTDSSGTWSIHPFFCSSPQTSGYCRM